MKFLVFEKQKKMKKKSNKKTTIKKSYRILHVNQKVQNDPRGYKHQLVEGSFFPNDYNTLEEAEIALTSFLLKHHSMDEFTIITIYK